MTRSIAQNIHSGLPGADPGTSPVISRAETTELAKLWTSRLNVKAIDDDSRVIEPSGGDQQKAVVAKALVQKPKLIILDEPARSVDMGAIAEIHEAIRELADSGMSVVAISSRLPEILKPLDRILLHRSGRAVEAFAIEETTEEKIMYAAVHRTVVFPETVREKIPGRGCVR